MAGQEEQEDRWNGWGQAPESGICDLSDATAAYFRGGFPPGFPPFFVDNWAKARCIQRIAAIRSAELLRLAAANHECAKNQRGHRRPRIRRRVHSDLPAASAGQYVRYLPAHTEKT